MKKSLYIAHNKTMQKNFIKNLKLEKKYQLGVKWLEPDAIKKLMALFLRVAF